MKRVERKVDPINVLNSIGVLNEFRLKTHSIQLPKADPKVYEDTAKSMRKACLNIVTQRDLRCVLVFEFKEKGTLWTLYEQNLSESERKGLLIITMKLMKHNMAGPQLPIEINGSTFIKDKKPIIRHLEGFKEEDKVFVITVSKDTLFVDGNAYDESTLCLAYLQKQHRFNGQVIRNVKHGQSSQEILIGEPMNNPKVTQTPLFPPV